MRPVRLAPLVVVAVVALSACLASDERETPGLVTMTVEPSVATRDGFDTSDGWRVTFQRFVSAAGSVTLDTPDAPGSTRDDPESCVDYTNARYDRLFDFAHTERADLGLAYGLGACSARWRLKSPSTDSLVQPGASEEDLTFMRTKGTDKWEDDARVSVWVVGEATKAGVTKRFEWVFRRGDRVSGCTGAGGQGFVDEVTLQADGNHALRGVVRGEELFRSAIDPTAPLVFEPFAGADADGDGNVTLDELDAVTVDVEVPPALTEVEPPQGPGEPVDPPKTLADLLYEWQVRRLGTFAGAGDCSLE